MSIKELKPINLYIPSKNQILILKEGSGDNLSYADRQEGYVDYIYFTQYDLGNDLEEVDGGILMYDEYLVDKYKSLEEAIDDILNMAYDSDDINYVDYVILKPESVVDSEELE